MERNVLLTWVLVGLIVILVPLGIYFTLHDRSTKVIESTNTIDKVLGIPRSTMVYHGIPLIDRTVYNGENCYGEYLGMRIEVKPCNVDRWEGMELKQRVNFTWTGSSQRNITWIFVYEGQLQSGGIDLWKQEYYNQSEYQTYSQWISNIQVTGVINYTNLGAPDYHCQFGNQNNTQMYFIGRYNVTGSLNSEYWCFTNVTVVNATTFRVSGNIDTRGLVTMQYYGYHWKELFQILWLVLVKVL